MSNKAECVGCFLIQAGKSTALRCLVRVVDKVVLGMDRSDGGRRLFGQCRNHVTTGQRRCRTGSRSVMQGSSHGGFQSQVNARWIKKLPGETRAVRRTKFVLSTGKTKVI